MGSVRRLASGGRKPGPPRKLVKVTHLAHAVRFVRNPARKLTKLS